jgi:hypothetical protein
MTRRRPARPRVRKWTVPTSGIRPPQRIGPKALLYPEPGEFLCIQWLLRRLERREPLVRRDLAFECGIRTATAVAFLKSNWVPWAQAFLALGNTDSEPETRADQQLLQIRRDLRETLGNNAAALQDPDKERIAG